MNATVYLFLRNSNTHSQYPADNARAIFQKLLPNRNVKTALGVYRQINLMYYAYFKQIASGYLGVAVVLNGSPVVDLPSLFELFDEFTNQLIVQGEIATLNEQGEVVASINSFYGVSAIADKLIESFRKRLANTSIETQLLPPFNYGVDAEICQEWNLQDWDKHKSEMSEATFVRIYKDSGVLVIPSQKIIAKLSQEKTQLETNLATLNKSYNALKRTQKQISWVVFLLSLLLIGGIVAFFVIKEKERSIEIREETIATQKSEIEEKDRQIEGLHDDLQTERIEKYKLNSRLNIVKSTLVEIQKYYPFIIKRITVDRDISYEYGRYVLRLYPTITFDSYVSESVVFYVKVISPNGNLLWYSYSPYGYTYKYNTNVTNEDRDRALTLSQTMNLGDQYSRGSYKVEIYYEGRGLIQYSFTL